eukprot:TRINITY_DN4118_c0_g1_i1.p1 TRINITY_DN4118_c0_g1~~TRINITY_DN4118_c0_g1_i1.p1  ORF type:complete len:57 (+),score=3.38 TRINITY_DN4118_c0_g1_i1:315-485(+)
MVALGWKAYPPITVAKTRLNPSLAMQLDSLHVLCVDTTALRFMDTSTVLGSLSVSR